MIFQQIYKEITTIFLPSLITIYSSSIFLLILLKEAKNEKQATSHPPKIPPQKGIIFFLLPLMMDRRVENGERNNVPPRPPFYFWFLLNSFYADSVFSPPSQVDHYEITSTLSRFRRERAIKFKKWKINVNIFSYSKMCDQT